MAEETCENCGADEAVQAVTYAVGDERRTNLLCPACKERHVAKRRVRRRVEPSGGGRRRWLRQTLRSGGVQAYLGFGLLLLGFALLPLLFVLSRVLR